MIYFDTSANTRGIRNKNPFNICKSSANWLGKVKGDDLIFETFSNMEFGVRAGIKLLSNYIRKCKDVTNTRVNTISKIIYRFAPLSENDTEQYIYYLCKQLNCQRDTVVSYPSILFADLCCAIMFYESQYFVPRDHIYYIINKFKLY